MRLNDFSVPSDSLNVRGGFRIEAQSMAGNTSGTDRTSEGIKPKTFNVSLLVKFKNASQLTQLVRIAEAVDSNGKQRIYDVVDPTINVASVRQVQFTDNVSWREDGDLHAWQVSFALIEYKSVPEKAEMRQAPQAAAPQTAPGEEIAAGEPVEEAEAEATRFEKFLGRIDKALA